MALPSGYTQLKYIKSDGNAWFDTGVKATAKTTAKYKYLTNKILTYGPHVLTGSAWYFPMVRGIESAGTFVVNRGGNEMGSSAIAPKTGFVYEVDAHFVDNKVTVNGVEYGGYTVGSIAVDTVNLHLFTPGVAPGDSQFSMDGQMWYCQIAEDGVLIRDYVPAQNSSGKVGMYDMVSGAFRTSDGPSEFTAGPMVSGPVEGTGVSLLDGVSGGINAGECFVDGTAYAVTEGETLVDGTGYDISIGPGAIPVTITGSGAATYCQVVINGQTYTSAASGIEVSAGDVITFTVYSAQKSTPGKVIINGEVVASVTGTAAGNGITHEWTVPKGCASISIQLYIAKGSLNRKLYTTATVTTT